MFTRCRSLPVRFHRSSLAGIAGASLRRYPLMQAFQSDITLELETAQAKTGAMKKLKRLFHRKEGSVSDPSKYTPATVVTSALPHV